VILTVTLNTSLDKLYTVEGFRAGEVIRVKEAHYTAGGKGLNVARVVFALGEQVLATGLAGGFAGGFIESELERAGIPFEFTRISGESRSCINMIDESTHTQTELLEPGPLVSREEADEFLKTYETLLGKADVITMSGSAPRGMHRGIYRTMIEMARRNERPVILDSSGDLLREGIGAGPAMVKPNASEAGAILGKTISSVDEAVSSARELTRLGAKTAVISMGERGLVAFFSSTGEAYSAVPPVITAVNTVGCGDALVAGFAVGLIRGYAFEETVRLAAAASSASALTQGTGECREEDVERVLREVVVSRLNKD